MTRLSRAANEMYYVDDSYDLNSVQCAFAHGFLLALNEVKYRTTEEMSRDDILNLLNEFLRDISATGE